MQQVVDAFRCPDCHNLFEVEEASDLYLSVRGSICHGEDSDVVDCNFESAIDDNTLKAATVEESIPVFRICRNCLVKRIKNPPVSTG